MPNPGSGQVSVITNGPDSWGEQRFVSVPELIDEAAELRGEEINFQLWLNAESDVFTRIRRLPNRPVVLEFDLGGLALAEQERVVAALRGILDSERADCLGFVIDRRGASEDVEWDRVMNGEPVPVGTLPDTLALRREVAARHPELPVAQATEYGALVIFDRPA
jgi:hypothetical protein